MNTKEAIFAGGCFWCTEHDLRAVPGVIDAFSGYTGGSALDANYEAVSNHGTLHREAVRVIYDPNRTTFKKLTQFFLDHIDPTDPDGQFGDRGENYKTAIYFENDEEKSIAESLIEELSQSGIYENKIVVQILPKKPFFTGEEYHQKYAEKNSVHYAMYRKGSGREDFVNNVCQIREEKKINWKD